MVHRDDWQAEAGVWPRWNRHMPGPSVRFRTDMVLAVGGIDGLVAFLDVRGMEVTGF